jgi:hypothetical protein
MDKVTEFYLKWREVRCFGKRKCCDVFSVFVVINFPFQSVHNTRFSKKKVPNLPPPTSTVLMLITVLNFLDRFSKNPETSGFMNIFPVGAELFITARDRQTDWLTN